MFENPAPSVKTSKYYFKKENQKYYEILTYKNTPKNY